MAIIEKKDVNISEITTFRMGGTAKAVVELETKDDVASFFNSIGDNKWFILGGGSNVVFPDTDFDITFVKLKHGKIIIDSDDGESVFITVPAGNVWDDVVDFAVSKGLSGIEALSAIPGTMGATPIQNVGAYGAEIKDVLHTLLAYDILQKKFVTLSNDECEFSYRDSIFKHKEKGRYLIFSVTLKLSYDLPNVPMYPGVDTYFAQKNISQPTLSDIRNAIVEIRSKKLPDPREIASVGSFFKNPFVNLDLAKELHEKYPDLKMFPSDNGTVKIPAGWLIEKAGFKGKNFGTISVYGENALVLVNNGGATRDELDIVISTIVNEVEKAFKIRLEAEPEILSF